MRSDVHGRQSPEGLSKGQDTTMTTTTTTLTLRCECAPSLSFAAVRQTKSLSTFMCSIPCVCLRLASLGRHFEGRSSATLRRSCRISSEELHSLEQTSQEEKARKRLRNFRRSFHDDDNDDDDGNLTRRLRLARKPRTLTSIFDYDTRLFFLSATLRHR